MNRIKIIDPIRTNKLLTFHAEKVLITDKLVSFTDIYGLKQDWRFDLLANIEEYKEGDEE